ncbi:MAG: hypothetical protein RLZZ30_200 [Bacteroidota bacterium]
MRTLYFIFNIFLNYSLRLYFRNIRLVNSTKSRFSRTIFVSNHPSAFMDPLIVSVLRKPIVFFMTRSDVFSKWSTPFLSSAHMIPIYRQNDGVNAVEKNKETFRKATEVLNRNRSLLIFGEGLTDDIFERRLKPLKKGAVRIGFTALEATNWEKEIRIVGIGCNYSNPGVMRSDILMAESEPIILNDYKDAYLENPSKTINELNRVVEAHLISVITNIELDSDFEFHEQVMMLTRSGMSPLCYDQHIPLEKRWRYSQELAKFINQFKGDYPNELRQLSQDVKAYFEKLKENQLSEEVLYRRKNSNQVVRLLQLIILFPIALLGFVHAYTPYIIIKRFVEKSFKRKVFWCSVKMVVTMVLMQLINLPLLFILPGLLSVGFWPVFAYYLSIGLIGLIWYNWRKQFFMFISDSKQSNEASETQLWEERATLILRIEQTIPVNISSL